MKYMTWLLLSAVAWSQAVTFTAEPPEPVFTMSPAYCGMIMWRGTDHLLHVKHSCPVPVELAVLPDQILLLEAYTIRICASTGDLIAHTKSFLREDVYACTLPWPWRPLRRGDAWIGCREDFIHRAPQVKLSEPKELNYVPIEKPEGFPQAGSK